MKYGNLYTLLLTIILSFIILFASDFLGDLNPFRVVSNEISQIIYNRGD